jgi:hypothetical protein
MAKDKEEKTYYIVNSSFISHNILGVILPRNHFVAVNEEKLNELKTNAMFNSLIKSKDLDIRTEIDDSMRTTEEQLAVSKTELVKAKQEAEALKDEALAEIKKRDDEIAALKAELEKAKKDK